MRGALLLVAAALIACQLLVPASSAAWNEELTISGQVRTGEWRPKYRVILDGKQVASYSSQSAAEMAAEDAINRGQAKKGEVHRSTDSAVIREFSIPELTPVQIAPTQQISGSDDKKAPPAASPITPP